MKAFMALALHYLTKDFRLQYFSLVVRPVLEKPTGDMIQNEMVE